MTCGAGGVRGQTAQCSTIYQHPQAILRWHRRLRGLTHQKRRTVSRSTGVHTASHVVPGVVRVGAGVTTLVSVTYFVAAAHGASFVEWLPRGGAAVLPGLCTLLTLVALDAVWRHRRGAVRAMAAACALLLVGLMAAMAGSRALLEWQSARASVHWPPRFADAIPTASTPSAFRALTDAQQARWAARVAQHRLLTDASAWVGDSVLTMPRVWAFPDDAQIARVVRGNRVETWARSRGGAMVCVSVPMLDEHRECGDAPAPATTAFVRVLRVDAPGAARVDAFNDEPVASQAVADRASSPTTAWTQYRGDAAHAARRAGSATRDTTRHTTRAWRHSVDGTIRSAVSLAAGYAMIGAHGTGAIEVLDAATGALRWRTRVPNWVHMDIVSDGRIAAVGFGDNDDSFTGRAPSGVSVFDLATGHLSWTRFDESSNMSGPLIRDSVVIYGTALGVIRTRRIADGALLFEDTLPGGVTMAPLAASGDTIVFTHDHDGVCAVLAPTLRRLWCRRFHGYQLMGHAAPTLYNGTVFLSAVTTLGNLSLAEMRALPWSVLRSLITSTLFPRFYEAHAGQRLFALDLLTGADVWRSTNAPHVRWVEGHVAGTATVTDALGIVVLPEADVVRAFAPTSGLTRWEVPAHLARGPALLIGSDVVVTGMDGVFDVLDAQSGRVRCTGRRASGFDRSGPVVFGDHAILATRDGALESIALDALRSCADAPPPASPTSKATAAARGRSARALTRRP